MNFIFSHLRTAVLLFILVLSASVCTICTPAPITLAFLGDIMIGRDVSFHHQESDWDTAFAAITPALQQADIALGNLESPVCMTNACISTLQSTFHNGTNPSTINLCAVPDGLDMLNTSGLSVLTLVNNHAEDCFSFDAPTQTEKDAFWQKYSLKPILSENQPFYQTINGIHLAFFAFDDVSAPLDIEGAKQLLTEISKDVDITIVSMHWGHEYQASPSPRQRMLASILSAAGADIIWGHHPHVLQPMERIERDNALPTLVAYSLGNALFDQVAPQDTRHSAILLVDLKPNGELKIKAVPFEIDPFNAVLCLSDAKNTEKTLERLKLDLP